MIFLDLDNTLIHSLAFDPKGTMGPRTRVPVGEETFHTQLRGFALSFLKSCRTLAPTKLLTSATRSYALNHNETFTLGFRPEDIYAREDYLANYYGEHAGPVKPCPLLPSHIPKFLVDDLPPENAQAQLKQAFLGICPKSHLKIRPYWGGRDPEAFTEEVQTLLSTLATALCVNSHTKHAQKNSPKGLEFLSEPS
jgi:hypothetical protein